VFTAGRYGSGVSVSVVDSWMLERLAALRTPELNRLMLAVSALLGTIWTVKVLAWTTLVVLVVSKRFRHLLVGVVSVQVDAGGQDIGVGGWTDQVVRHPARR